jgi:hypothetical protein
MEIQQTGEATIRWSAVFHRTNGWMEAPEGTYFTATGDQVRLVGGVHRCGTAWYATSITKHREPAGVEGS